MVNSSRPLGHMALTEEFDHCNTNTNNNNNNTSFIHEFSIQSDEFFYHNSFQHAVYDTAVFDVLKVEPEDFASQITLMDLDVFKLITPEELTSCAWSSKTKLERAYHVVQFVRRFNQVNFWTQGEVLRADNLKSRIEILSHFIRIAKKLFDYNNINGCMAVVMALQSAPIYRLERTWMGLNKRDRTTFNNLKDFVASNDNWKQLRTHFSQTKLPCIPYLGIYLTDIIRIDTLHPYRAGLETPQRRNALNNICRVIAEFQQSTYDYLYTIECVQNYLISVRYIEELQTFIEDQNYKQSLSLESDVDQHDGVLEKSFSLKVTSISKHTIQSHRRAFSDCNHCHNMSLSSKTASLPCRRKIETSLLDDSVLANGIERFSFDDEISKPAHDFSSTPKYSSKIEPIFISRSSSKSQFEGSIERRCLLKNYKKPRMSQWKHYWLTICDHLLYFYKEKSFIVTLRTSLNLDSESNRSSYHEQPSKCHSISDWLIVLTEGKVSNEIQLSDLNRGSMYKFRFQTSSSARLWFDHLKRASNFQQRRISENLIALD